MLTAHEAFQIGFLMKCAEDGLSGEETAVRIEKAAVLLEKQAAAGSSYTGQALDLAGKGLSYGGAIGLGLPIVAGIGGGYLASKLTEGDFDEEDIRKQEMLHELRHWTQRAREHARRRTMRPPG